MTEEFVEINCLGLKCPLPVMRMERAFRAGETRLRLISDDPISVIDIPLALQKWEGTILAQTHHDDVYEFEIKRDIR